MCRICDFRAILHHKLYVMGMSDEAVNSLIREAVPDLNSDYAYNRLVTLVEAGPHAVAIAKAMAARDKEHG